jgi:TRAP-type C4-dicarboxylate transport system permease small subunit
MLAAPQLVRERKHVSMEIIDTALNESQRRFLIMCTDLVAAAVAGFVAYYAVTTGLEEWNRGNVLRLAIDVPRWIFFAVLASGFTLCVVEFLRHAYLAIAKGDIEPDQKESLPT